MDCLWIVFVVYGLSIFMVHLTLQFGTATVYFFSQEYGKYPFSMKTSCAQWCLQHECQGEQKPSLK